MRISVTAIIPTYNRASVLKSTFESIALQSSQPEETIVIDASDDEQTYQLCLNFKQLKSEIIWQKANDKGAAIQRNQGISLAKHDYVLFMDDDILLEPNCIERLWNCIISGSMIGGVNAMIKNQQYHTPGKVTRYMYNIMHGQNLKSYAGKCIGPAWNLLPEDNASLPDYINVEWLNTTCTMYRKESLPTPAFPLNFKGYSLMEDLCLSLIVARKYKLMNVRTARIFHDSQPGAHKKNKFVVSKMELINRHYIMSKILFRTKNKDYFKLFIFECFGIFSSLNSFKGFKAFIPTVFGKITATIHIMRNNVKQN